MKTILLTFCLGFSLAVQAVDDVKVVQLGKCIATLRPLDGGTQTVMQCPEDGTVTTSNPDGSTQVVKESGQVITLDAPKK